MAKIVLNCALHMKAQILTSLFAISFLFIDMFCCFLISMLCDIVAFNIYVC